MGLALKSRSLLVRDTLCSRTFMCWLDDLRSCARQHTFPTQRRTQFALLNCACNVTRSAKTNKAKTFAGHTKVLRLCLLLLFLCACVVFVFGWLVWLLFLFFVHPTSPHDWVKALHSQPHNNMSKLRDQILINIF